MDHNQPDTLLKLQGMTKTFPGVVANNHVDLVLHKGQIHALLGENGAGKSTLVKMIYGLLQPDAGQMAWQGTVVEVGNPAIARRLGIAMVFQHFSLFDSLSVTENIALGILSEQTKDLATLKARIIEVSQRYGLPLDPDRHVYTLSVGERQRIEIIRCLLQEPKLLVMDEPTSVLTPQEVTRLFETLRRLADEGVAILYISHKLDEIKALCHRATILREGSVVDCVQVKDESTHSLAAKMMGRQLEMAPARTQRESDRIRLDIEHLSIKANDEFGISLKDICLQVASGEIVGIAGVAGNGQDELLKALNGESLAMTPDCIKIDETPCAHGKPNQRRALGLASIPEERLGHGAVPQMSLIENCLLTAFQRLGFVHRGVIDRRRCGQYCDAVIEAFDVKANGAESAATSLSGGNLQKFIVGREILQKPGVLVVSQPTWGVDAGAAQTIHKALRSLADNGTAILVISQDIDELMSLSDRIAAICAGSLSPVFPTPTVTIETIGLMMAGVVDHGVSTDRSAVCQ